MTRLPSRRRDSGVVAILTALLMTTFIGFCAIAVDVGHWYLVKLQTQKAADAAALAGVVYLPDNVAGAMTVATQYAQDNGFGVSATTSVTTTRVPGDPGRLSVTVSTTVTNFFTGLFGLPTSTISSRGDAAYAGPVSMGSPCNRIGNDPDATPATGSSACSGLGTGRFWAGVSGERTDKQNGDPYQSTLCTGATSDNCPAGTNTDYTAEGYLYNITVKTAGATQIEIFDPDFVATGNQCDSTNLDGATAARNPFVKDATDANNRYGKGNSANSGWCTGDTNNLIGGATKEVMQTSYSVLGTQGGANIADHTPIDKCTRTWTGFDGALSAALDQKSPGYNVGVAESFRRWVPLCTVRGAGTYILKVNGAGGNAQNHFSIRAVGGDVETTTVSGRQRLGIFTSDDSPGTTFYLARVPSTSAGQTLVVRFFDVGDAKNAGKMTIKPPSGSVGCRQYDVRDAPIGSLDPCAITTSTSLNGRWITLRVPIPATYDCNDSNNAACWYTVSFDYKGAVPTDTSAWTAAMDGQAVRLVK
ncbi:pilus assembly protein TadG-related protein [Dermatophilaceae bacterium Soc4.6]